MRYVALLAVLVVLASVVAGASTPAAGDLAGAPEQPSPATEAALGPSGDRLALSVGAPRTNFTISLRADGSARWTVETRFPLEDESDRDAFREYADSYERGDAAGGPTVDTFRNAATKAVSATNREMSIEQVNRSTTIRNESGVLRLRFTWTGFLATGDEGTLVLGDAFRTADNATWFRSLSASQRLVIEPPENYEVSDVSQGFSYSISDRRIVAEGPQTFEAGDIEVAYEPGNPPTEGLLSPALLVGGGAVILILVVVAIFAYRRGGVRSGRGADADDHPPPSAGDSGDLANGDRTETATGRDEGVTSRGGEASVSPNGIGDSTTASDSGRPTDTAGAVDSEPDLELLSDEERVERLLSREGGRMRQANIVSETGWSDAKVSQLLSAMAEEGRVEKLRLGRENLISLAEDAEPDDGRDADDGDESNRGNGNVGDTDGDGNGAHGQ